MFYSQPTIFNVRITEQGTGAAQVQFHRAKFIDHTGTGLIMGWGGWGEGDSTNMEVARCDPRGAAEAQRMTLLVGGGGWGYYQIDLLH
jgi:hypothetical protein